jgi:hypothetical protein
MLSLTLADFVAALPFSNKIEDRQIQPFVAESYMLDLVPLLGHEVLEKIALLNQADTVTDYNPAVPVLGSRLYRQYERVYQSSAAGLITMPGGTGWIYQPLLTLWTQYLKLYWIRAAFARFLPQHGQDFTKAGITNPTDREGTFRPISAIDRATLQAAHDSATEALRSRLTAFKHTETQAYASDNTKGYDYGAACGCQAATSLRAPLRGINSRRRR